jgi:Protein of unknown function (DUF1275)
MGKRVRAFQTCKSNIISTRGPIHINLINISGLELMEIDKARDNSNRMPQTSVGSNRGQKKPKHEHWLSLKINTTLSSIPILLCCFISGLIDANVFNAWGVFASMQTGKLIC